MISESKLYVIYKAEQIQLSYSHNVSSVIVTRPHFLLPRNHYSGFDKTRYEGSTKCPLPLQDFFLCPFVNKYDRPCLWWTRTQLIPFSSWNFFWSARKMSQLIRDQGGHLVLSIGPKNDLASCQVSLNSVQWFQRRSRKYEKLTTDGRRTTRDYNSALESFAQLH